MSRPAETVEYPDLAEVETPIPFQPYIPAHVQLRELTPIPLIVGTILGMIFGASSLYLVLKVGITVSASIPVAVISITLFKILSKFGAREATILEHNVVQTAGSAGESIAFGVGVTMPAIMILGFELEITRVMLVAILGGLLGILMMIPLRRALIVKQHGILKYPEGTACAEVLKAGASEESRAVSTEAGSASTQVTSARTIFTGFGVGVLYKSVMVAFKGWRDTPEKVFGKPFEAGSVSAEISPELLGVGYIIGPRIAGLMAAGGVLAYLVLIPAIKFFGSAINGVLAPGSKPIADMDPSDIRSAYVLYIGAGCVATAGIISVFRSMPTIWNALRHSLKDVRGSQDAGSSSVLRTDRDIPMKWVLIGIGVLVIAIVAARPLHMNILGAILIVVFGFLFVTVSSRLTGEIGSTSNPISGMTYATLLLTSLIFLALNWTDRPFYVTALSVGAIVCIAASNGGTTSQDLKTGFLVGSTPRNQQIAILIGAFASALILGPILLGLNENYTGYLERTSFQRVQPSAPIDAAVIPALPQVPQGTDVPAPGNYRYLRVGTGPSGFADLTPGEYLVDEKNGSLWKSTSNFPPQKVDVASLGAKTQQLPPRLRTKDPTQYHPWINIDPVTGRADKYLVNDAGQAVYLVDPGINGVHKKMPDGTEINKFDAPKAVLVSYIIKGILDQKLPWGLVLLGAMIALTLEMSGIPSLAFAVGVYLPLSTSSTIFIGGVIRWVVDLYLRKKYRSANLTEEQLVAETDKSPGVLMASGYIAGGAIAGIVIAFMSGLPSKALEAFNKNLDTFAKDRNPFYGGENAHLLSLIPFVLLVALLYLTGRELIMRGRREEKS